MWYSGEASWGNLGKVRRLLQQEEHHNVWRHWAKLPNESAEWAKGIIVIITFSSWIISLITRGCSLCVIRSDHSWRPTWTERKTGSCINYLNTSKKSPSSMTSVGSTTNTGRGKGRLPSAHLNNPNSWIEACRVCLANTWTRWRLCHYITVTGDQEGFVSLWLRLLSSFCDVAMLQEDLPPHLEPCSCCSILTKQLCGFWQATHDEKCCSDWLKFSE